jgi:hypothetical protein
MVHNFATSIVHHKKALGTGSPFIGSILNKNAAILHNRLCKRFDLSELDLSGRQKMGGVSGCDVKF